MTAVLDSAALLVTAAALLAAAVLLLRTANPPAALAALLDLLTAAGLLRLAGEPTTDRLAGAAAVIALRIIAAYGISAGRRPPTTPRG